MANSLVGYIALLRQFASFYKGWVGDHCRDRSIFIMTYMDSRGWGEPTPPICQLLYSLYNLHAARFGPLPQTKFLATPMWTYMSDDVASDNEDSKRIKRVEERAEQKKRKRIESKSTQESNCRKHSDGQSSSFSGSYDQRFFRGARNASSRTFYSRRNSTRKSFGPNDLCFECGKKIHWRSPCPESQQRFVPKKIEKPRIQHGGPNTHPKFQDSTSIRKSSKIGGTDLWERDD